MRLRHRTLLHVLYGILAFPVFLAFAQDVQCPMEKQVKVTVQTNPYPSLPGQLVQINIFVEPIAAIFDPTGTVQIADGSTDLGTFPLRAAGQASLNRTSTNAEAHALTVGYSADF